MGVSKVRDIAVDPRFSVPVGVVDVRQQGGEEGDYYYDESTRAAEGPTLLTPTSNIPMPPSSYSIAEQRVRISSDGRAVVDVYLDFPDIEGVERIEVSVTKA